MEKESMGGPGESVYLELKGIIIDWAKPELDPEEIIIMLKRLIKELESGAVEGI